MRFIGKNSVRAWFFQVATILALFSSGLAAETFCDHALKISDRYGAPARSPIIDFKITENASRQARELGLSHEELQILISESRLGSYEKGEEYILPIFRTVRSAELYRDYIYILKLRRPFVVNKKAIIHILDIEKPTEKGQRPYLEDLARHLRIRPHKLMTRVRRLHEFGFPKGPVRVEIDPATLVKLQFKHKIDLKLLNSALQHRPDAVIQSDRTLDRVEMHYHGDNGIMLIIVLAYSELRNSAALVTSYFTFNNSSI